MPARVLAGDNCIRINGEFWHNLKVVSTNDTLSFPNSVHEGMSEDTGNAVFGDGAVQRIKSSEWATILNQSNQATNRFLFP
jgi:hypothetical protein